VHCVRERRRDTGRTRKSEKWDIEDRTTLGEGEEATTTHKHRKAYRDEENAQLPDPLGGDEPNAEACRTGVEGGVTRDGHDADLRCASLGYSYRGGPTPFQG
jgi:hypothetical protein